MWWSVGDNIGKRICGLERAAFPYMGSCCSGFGNGCVNGYKRLWCWTWPGAPPTPIPSAPSTLPKCRDVEGQGQDGNRTDGSWSEAD